MTLKLPPELAAALEATTAACLEVVDPTTSRTYVIVDANTHRLAMDALQRQHDRDAIAQGLAELAAGQGQPLDPALDVIRSRIVQLTDG